MQAAKELADVDGLTRQFSDFKERRLQMLRALALGDFGAQRVVQTRQLGRAARDFGLESDAMQDAVERHRHMPRDDEKERTVLRAVDARRVVDLHRHHAEHFVRRVLQRRAHPELRPMPDTLKAPRRGRLDDALLVDQKRLARGQHVARQ